MSLQNGLICVLKCETGYAHLIVKMTATTDGVVFHVLGDDLAPGEHGFHVHNTGNLTEGCKSLGPHYNPTHANHGGLNQRDAHYGDLGNIIIDKNRRVNVKITSRLLTLSELLGRSLVLHSKRDDLGLGGDPESLRTGNSGSRICCGVIGFA